MVATAHIFMLSSLFLVTPLAGALEARVCIELFAKETSFYEDMIAQHKDFMDKYAEPDDATLSQRAAKIKAVLKEMGVAYSMERFTVVIKPIRKPGLNEFAFQMMQHKNTRIVFNMHAYSNKKLPPRDDYFQGHSDNRYTNLILSEDFLRDVAQGDWDVPYWVNNAKTYFIAYNKPLDVTLDTQIVLRDPNGVASQQGVDLQFGEKIRGHAKDMEDAVYNLSQNPFIDVREDFVTAQEKAAKFSAEMTEISEYLSPFVNAFKLNDLITVSDLLPFLSHPIIQQMDLRLTPNGEVDGVTKYKVLITLNLNSTTINFYLQNDLKISRPLSTLVNPHKAGFFGSSLLTKDELHTLTMHTGAHFKELLKMLNTLVRISVNYSLNANSSQLDGLLIYNQDLIDAISDNNRDFIY